MLRGLLRYYFVIYNLWPYLVVKSQKILRILFGKVTLTKSVKGYSWKFDEGPVSGAVGDFKQEHRRGS